MLNKKSKGPIHGLEFYKPVPIILRNLILRLTYGYKFIPTQKQKIIKFFVQTIQVFFTSTQLECVLYKLFNLRIPGVRLTKYFICCTSESVLFYILARRFTSI